MYGRWPRRNRLKRGRMSGDLRMAVTTAHIEDLEEGMASVNQNSEASNDMPKPDAQSKGVTFKFGFDVDMEEAGASGAEDDTARASKPRKMQTPI
jgi:hypothetical protein